MKLINLIFPKKCAACGEFTEGDVFCRICASKYEQLKREPCKKCGNMHYLCRCRSEKLANENKIGARHLFAYGGDMSKNIIYKLKRKNLPSLQKFFAQELAGIIKDEIKSDSEYIVTFAPRSKKSVREYGFDQAEILSKECAKILSLPWDSAFERDRKANTQQKTLNAKEREENVKEAFSIYSETELKGKTLILIDDVTTTGSTAASLCELALCEGTAEILFLSIAKT